MSAPLQQCAHCGQWLNLEINRYIVGKTAHGRRHFLHPRACAQRFAEIHQIAIEQEVRDDEVRLYT